MFTIFDCTTHARVSDRAYTTFEAASHDYHMNAGHTFVGILLATFEEMKNEARATPQKELRRQWEDLRRSGLNNHLCESCRRCAVRFVIREREEALKAWQPVHVIHIEGRRWFQRSAGNTYHSARIFVDGLCILTSGRHYGYGDQFIGTATAMLVGTEYVPEHFEETQSTLVLREVLKASYSVIDVGREKDL